MDSHVSIIKRVGAVLVVIGLIDIGMMVYCIVHGLSYHSSFNIFALVAGIFLLSGGLRAASLVRWFAAFLAACFCTSPILSPLFVPIDLTLTRARLYPASFWETTALSAVIIALLIWIARELWREPVQEAIVKAGLKWRNLRWAVAAGIGSTVVIAVIANSFLTDSAAAERAKSTVEQELGPNYRFHVSYLRVTKNVRGKLVSGNVTAWNAKEIREVPVSWSE